MSYQIEYEQRIMLTEEEYALLLNEHRNKGNILKIINDYLDTPLFDIRKSHSNLRIRSTNNSNYELTLKVKGDNGDKEITQVLDLETLNNIKSTNILIDGEVKEYLSSLNIETSLILFWGQVEVDRIEIPYLDSLIVLDFNRFGNIIDYNLEVESSSIEKAKEILDLLCKKFNISQKESYSTKSSRAYKYFIKN